MRFVLALACICLASLLLSNTALTKPVKHQLETIEDNPYVDRVGDVDGTTPRVSKVAIDTIWIADWSF